MIKYLIDNVDLATYGVRVSETGGLLDVPRMKRPLSVNWPDRHGEQVELSAPRFEAREITLSCYMMAQTRVEFLTKVNELAAGLLMIPGLRQLIVEYDNTRPLAYMVYFPQGLDIKRSTRWNAARHTGCFQLRLREPEPVKKVLRFQASGGNMQADVAFSSPGQVTIHWGDGSVAVTSTSNPVINHTYTQEGTYVIVMAGVIEGVTDLVTNATVIWDKI